MSAIDPTGSPRYDFNIYANNAAAFDGRLNLRELGTSANFSAGLAADTTYLVEVEFIASTTIKAYVNGVQVASATTTQPALTVTTASLFATTTTNMLNGKLCETFFANAAVVGGSQHAGLKTGINTRWGTSL
jgi:hypothetical protein